MPKTLVESTLKISTDMFARSGYFRTSGLSGMLVWDRLNASCLVTINLCSFGPHCQFDIGGSRFHVGLTFYRPGYGGRRYAFVCPTCGRSMRTMHFYKDRLACRICLDLTYNSCNKSHQHDALARDMLGELKAYGHDITWQQVRQEILASLKPVKHKRPRGRPRKVGQGA